MFGYIVCSKKGLSEAEKARYQGLYCGVCKALRKEFGQIERLTLSYDMTFLALFLSALYEPEEKTYGCHCVMHPGKNKEIIENKFTEYAASMNLALVYHKCMDDWKDEHKYTSLGYGKIIRQHYQQVEKRYPRQCRVIEESLREMEQIEKNPDSLADDAINCSGRMLSEVFVYEEDFWSSTLRNFGYELGRFIYLLDAVMDYEKDGKKKNYNPLFRMDKKPEDMKPFLMMAIGNAAEEFEKLPIVKDEHMIRNVLYAGVWQQYNAKYARKETQNG